MQNYGAIAEVWFDGACGEGPSGKRQVYDWPGFVAVVRSHQPGAVIFSDAGPDVRWVGNEAGHAGETNWGMLRRDEFYPGIPQRERELNEGHADGTVWLPAECDVSIRPSWYYHASEDDRVKSLRELIDIYFASVGRNASLLLNLPVDRRGLVHENDAARLLELRRFLDAMLARDYLNTASAHASSSRAGLGAERVCDQDERSYWASDGELRAPVEIELTPAHACVADVVELREPIRLGQRVAAFQVDGLTPDGWQQLAAGTTVGRRRWLRFPRTELAALRVTISRTRANACAALSTIALYATPDGAAAADAIELRAGSATVQGKIQLAPGHDALGGWTDGNDRASWQVEAARGAYEVELTYACAPDQGGAQFEVRCGDSAAGGKIHSTGDGGRFLTVPVGLLELPGGTTRISVRATSGPNAAGMNLRAVTLRPGYRPLFDGNSLAGWHLVAQEGPGYLVDARGVLVCPEDGGGNLFTEQEYQDFSFRFEFRLFDGSNNGIGIRAPYQGDAAYVGMEIQVLDNESEQYRDRLQPWQYHGSIYGVVPAPRGFLRPTGDWNCEEIIARGRRITVILNGTRLIDSNLDDVTDPEVLAKHPGLQRTGGHIGFLGHRSRVEFRNIRVRPLP
ncbi:MAG: family 16 glycoside hydrolase [Planctomycetota bacterium]